MKALAPSALGLLVAGLALGGCTLSQTMTRTMTTTVTRTTTEAAADAQVPMVKEKLDAYVRAHLSRSDASAVLAESLDGGETTVVNGQSSLAGISLDITTRLYPRRENVALAVRICSAALGAIARLPIHGVSYVNVDFDQTFSHPDWLATPALATASSDTGTCVGA
jgi:hypothetical protein